MGQATKRIEFRIIRVIYSKIGR